MLAWGIKCKIPLNLVCDTITEFSSFKLTINEWNLLHNVVKYLKPFKTIAQLLSGAKYCTISIVVLSINVLINKLEKSAFDLDTPYRNATDEKLIFAINSARDKILKHYKKNKLDVLRYNSFGLTE